MNSYNIPFRGKGVDESGYQHVLGLALRTAGRVPVLVPPKSKFRGAGKAWMNYKRF